MREPHLLSGPRAPRRRPGPGRNAAHRGRGRRAGPRGAVAGGRRRGLHPGPADPGRPRPGTRLGRDGVREPGRRQGPAAFLSARARGVSFLAAPVAALTTSVTALRVWLALLSGLGLFLALRTWRPCCRRGCSPGGRPVRDPVDGAVLRAAGRAQPVGGVRRFRRRRLLPARRPRPPASPGPCWASGAAVAFVALMRPSDAVPLVLVLARRRCWCRVAAPGAVGRACRGAAAGSAEWVIEAYVRYGGLAARLDRASEIQGELGLYIAVDDHVRALGGRTLCRPCDVPWRNPVTGLWFLVLPLCVAGGVRAAAGTPAPHARGPGHRGRVRTRAPLPVHRRLRRPCASCSRRTSCSPCRSRCSSCAWRTPALRRRRALLGVCVLALLAHLAIQYKVLDSVTRRVRTDTVTLTRIAEQLHAHGVRPPCVVSGEDAVRIAYRAGCASRQPGGHDASITPDALARLGERRPVAVLLSGEARARVRPRLGGAPAPRTAEPARFPHAGVPLGGLTAPAPCAPPRHLARRGAARPLSRPDGGRAGRRASRGTTARRPRPLLPVPGEARMQGAARTGLHPAHPATARWSTATCPGEGVSDLSCGGVPVRDAAGDRGCVPRAGPLPGGRPGGVRICAGQ